MKISKILDKNKKVLVEFPEPMLGDAQTIEFLLNTNRKNSFIVYTDSVYDNMCEEIVSTQVTESKETRVLSVVYNNGVALDFEMHMNNDIQMFYEEMYVTITNDFHGNTVPTKLCITSSSNLQTLQIITNFDIMMEIVKQKISNKQEDKTVDEDPTVSFIDAIKTLDFDTAKSCLAKNYNYTLEKSEYTTMKRLLNLYDQIKNV